MHRVTGNATTTKAIIIVQLLVKQICHFGLKESNNHQLLRSWGDQSHIKRGVHLLSPWHDAQVHFCLSNGRLKSLSSIRVWSCVRFCLHCTVFSETQYLVGSS